MGERINWKCGCGLHRWKHSDELTIGGGRYRSPHGNEVTVVRRTIYYKECERCHKQQQYYPNTKQLVDIVRARRHPSPRGGQ